MRLFESPPAGADKDTHERGNGTGIELFKNRRYLRKKSFFERFFAHKTGRDTKENINDKLTVSHAQIRQPQAFR